MINLYHYTNSINALVNILNHGFAWMRNDRVVIESLLPNADFSKREPESFGQVCFSENSYLNERDKTKFFGSFGLQVSEAWVRKHQAQPVIYIYDEGPVHSSFRFLFTQLHSKAMAEEKYPDDAARQMWETSRAMAGVVGQPLYAHLLGLYRFMEPASNFSEREWRIVNPEPDYSISNETDKAINNVSPPEGWAKILNVVPVQPGDIVSLHCKQSDKDELESSLPNEFKATKIYAH